MKTEEIHSLLGVPPATLFDWNKPGHKKKPLAELLKAIDAEEAKTLIKKGSTKQPKPMMLLSTVNGSIGDSSKHFTLTKLKTLFYKKEPFNAYEKYAIKVMKQEAMPSEIEAFVNYYKIAPKRVEQLLSA